MVPYSLSYALSRGAKQKFVGRLEVGAPRPQSQALLPVFTT